MSSDSDDDMPLMQRAAQPKKPDPKSDSEDEVPLSQRAAAKPATATKPKPKPAAAKPKPAPKKKMETESDDNDDGGDSSEDDDDDDEDFEDDDNEVPLAKRKAAKKSPAKKKPSSASKRKREEKSSNSSGSKKSKGSGDGQAMWETLVHSGVLFPPEYEPHGIKMLYDGKPVDLTPDQEEVASMFAIMKETDYMNKPKFLQNFWNGFKEVLGKNHVIKSLVKCDFTPMYDYQMAEREKKKLMTKEVRRAGLGSNCTH
jgi:DNA topoisomerase-1